MKKECEKIRVKWVRKQRRLDLFLKDHEDWLNEDFTFNMLVAPEDLSRPSTSGGRPQKSFIEVPKNQRKEKCNICYIITAAMS